MWGSSVEEKVGSSRRSSSLTSSSSTSSSSSSTVPPLPPPSQLSFSLQQQQQQQIVVPNPTTSSSLEDVWKDIRLSSLNVNVNVNPSSSSSKSKDINLNPVIFQDFFGKESLMKVLGSSSSTGRCVPPAPPSPADTFLSLTPVALPGFNILFKEKQQQQQQQQQPPLLKSPSFSDSGFCSSSVGSGGVKRDIDPSSDSAGGGDHRHKRMIKNRESACRSRARKQAYTNELELAVNNLKKENAGLKEQLNQFHIAAAAQQYSRNQPLKRTSTAPF